MAIALEEERIIQRAARAERAYWRLIHRASEDQAHRLELMDRRIQVDAQLAGKNVLLEAPLRADLTLTLDRAVDQELRAMRQGVTIGVMRRRQLKRDAGCSPFTSIVIGYTTRARSRLREIWKSSGLSLRELASAFGVSSSTIERHLSGEPIARSRKEWYHAVKSVRVDDEGIHIIVSRSAPTRPKWGWNLSREEQRRAYAGGDRL